MIKINKTYNKVKDVFVAPKNAFFFGRWRKSPGLPIWRRGNYIKIFGKSFNLPIWLSFYIFNWDLFYKTKWTSYDFRYEFPPTFGIVFFGLCFYWWKYWPHSEHESSDHYWTSILSYLHGEKPGDLFETMKAEGKWTTYNKDNIGTSYFTLQQNYLKPEYWDEYDEAVKKYREWQETIEYLFEHNYEEDNNT